MKPRQRLFQIISDAAERGLPCPGNLELAEAVGYERSASVGRALSFMARDGFIRVEVQGHYRRVEIVATGKITADARPNPGPEQHELRRQVREIVATVALAAGIDEAEIFGRSRARLVVRPRMLACHFARAEGWSFGQIGKVLRRDHSSVIHACRQIEPLRGHNRSFALLFDRTAAMIAGIEPKTVYIAPTRWPLTEPRREFVATANQRNPLDIDPDDHAQIRDLHRRREASDMLLRALRRAYPERCAA